MIDTVRPCPTARKATPNAAVDFPLPFPVFIKINPRAVWVFMFKAIPLPPGEGVRPTRRYGNRRFCHSGKREYGRSRLPARMHRVLCADHPLGAKREFE